MIANEAEARRWLDQLPEWNAEAAARLYACLHLAAAAQPPRIAVAPVPDEAIGAAINDRLRRAAAP